MKRNYLIIIILIFIFIVIGGIVYFLTNNINNTKSTNKISDTNNIENNIENEANLNNEEIIKFELQTSEYFSNMPKEYKYIINSEEELEKFYEIYSDKLNIDKNYLNDNTIFVEVYKVNSGSIEKKLKDITFNDNTVNFIIDTEVPEIGLENMAFWYMVGIIPNKKLTNINTDNWTKPSDIK